MNRRAFFGRLAVLGGAALLPWRPQPALAFRPDAFRLTRGDIITIAGRYAVNPMTGKTTMHLKQFVVTADVTSAEIAARPVDTLHPRMIDQGLYRNVSSAAPFAGEDIHPFLTGKTL